MATAKARRTETVECIVTEDTRRLRGEVHEIGSGMRSKKMR